MKALSRKSLKASAAALSLSVFANAAAVAPAFARQTVNVVPITNPEYSDGGAGFQLLVCTIGLLVVLGVIAGVVFLVLKKTGRLGGSGKSHQQPGAGFSGAAGNRPTVRPQGAVRNSVRGQHVAGQAAAQKTCGQCGASVPASSAFCPKCGHRF